MIVTASDIVAVWESHAAGAPIEVTRDALARFRAAVTGRSVSSVSHLDVLDARLGEMSAGEWSAWWQVVTGWAHGFPPAAAPARTNAGTITDVACPNCGRDSHDIPGLDPAAIPVVADGTILAGPYRVCARCGVFSFSGRATPSP